MSFLKWNKDSIERDSRLLLPGMTIGALVAGLGQLGLWQPLEESTNTLMFQIRGDRVWDSRVVVIEIDDKSLKSLGAFPWSRQRYQKLIETLTPANPSVIGFDILMSEPSPQDAALAESMSRQGKVVMPQAWTQTAEPLLPHRKLKKLPWGLDILLLRAMGMDCLDRSVLYLVIKQHLVLSLHKPIILPKRRPLFCQILNLRRTKTYLKIYYGSIGDRHPKRQFTTPLSMFLLIKFRPLHSRIRLFLWA